MAKHKQITAKEATALADGETYSEKVSGRGAGVLLLVGRKSSVSAYYRYTDPDGKRPWIELGGLSSTFSIKDAREKCAELNADRKQHPHLKEWLEADSLRKRAADIAVMAEAKRAEQMATLEDLLNDYVAHLRQLGRTSADQVEKCFAKVVFKDAAHIASMRAQEIGPEHIVEILRPITARGAKVHRNRVRSYLRAAFQYGLKGEYDETRTSAKSFGLTTNPVAAVPALAGVEKEEAVFDSSLNATTKLILFALSMYADQHGKSCWPTQEDIAKKANCTSRSVRDHLHKAEADGWFSRYQRQRQGKTGFNYGYILQLRPEQHSGS